MGLSSMYDVKPQIGDIKIRAIWPFKHKAEYEPKLKPHNMTLLKSYPCFIAQAKTHLRSL